MYKAAELLAPAGSWDCARAAVANGADAVYFGLPKFNARIRADNFTEEELPEVVEFCHRHGVKAYAAFNTLIFADELEDAALQLRLLNRAGVDAIIVQDVGLVHLAREIAPELPIHASTQMTITSPEGVRFAKELGIERVVLARELSLRDLEKFDHSLPLETFVHGALCVAYSGQCLTSESLGRRSANRGECAQACRMPYELLVDGAVRDLGDRRYLLSPRDLAAVDEIPALIERGICCFKIEGRLKSPEYVAAVCQVYRKAIDAALEKREGSQITTEDRYQLEMTFSRGLYSGWMHGVNHQELVSARFGKKRGPFAGHVERIGMDFIEIEPQVPLKPGDGIVFDTGGDTNAEQGGRIWQMKGQSLFFERGGIDFSRINVGDRVWKTDDPALNSRLRKSFSGRIEPRIRERVDLRVSGGAGEPLVVEAGNIAVRSAMALQAARTAPLTSERLEEHLGRFGGSVYALGELRNEIEGAVILPIAELNRLRRELVYQLDTARNVKRPESGKTVGEILDRILARHSKPAEDQPGSGATLSILCRDMAQISAALECGVRTIHVDFEDIRRYKNAVELTRQEAGVEVLLATPRIQKAGEEGFFKLIENTGPDGVLIRNPGAIEYFADKPLRKIGDFSLNVSNPLAAGFYMQKGLERLTISYDLNIGQVFALLGASQPDWFELTIHQHMPMFHMEHCVFAAFMSAGKTFLDCGRPCEKHRVHLRDRVGIEHPLRADVGCRNTLFNASAQTGASFYSGLRDAGLRHFRVELLEETSDESKRIIRAYQSLLGGECDGGDLWRRLKAQSQLGVTHGTYEGENRDLTRLV
jgi:putative protease